MDARARAQLQYKILQANVDQAFLWHYLYLNKDKVEPSPKDMRDIGWKIVNATGNPFFFNCHFYIVNLPVANAMTSPKGNVFFYQGLLDLDLSEEEGAAVIAHEVGHLVRSHWLARLKRGLQAAQWARYTAKTYGRNSAEIALLYRTIENLQFNRQEEYEADLVGAQLLVNAGYPAEAMAEVLEKLQAAEQKTAHGRASVAYLSSHPLTADRIQRLRRVLPLIKPQKRKLF